MYKVLLGVLSIFRVIRCIKSTLKWQRVAKLERRPNQTINHTHKQARTHTHTHTHTQNTHTCTNKHAHAQTHTLYIYIYIYIYIYLYEQSSTKALICKRISVQPNKRSTKTVMSKQQYAHETSYKKKASKSEHNRSKAPSLKNEFSSGAVGAKCSICTVFGQGVLEWAALVLTASANRASALKLLWHSEVVAFHWNSPSALCSYTPCSWASKWGRAAPCLYASVWDALNMWLCTEKYDSSSVSFTLNRKPCDSKNLFQEPNLL